MKGKFQLGDHVLLIYDRRRKWLKKIVEKEFHTNYGMINLADLVGLTYGEKIETHSGKWLLAIPPTLLDWFDHFEHGSQIIYAKDAAMIAMLVDAKPGAIILETGTGSGALTSVLSRSVGESGVVITHEVRESAYMTAKRNHERLGTKNVIFIQQNVAEKGFVNQIDGIEVMIDGVVLDMGDPWTVVEHVVKVLRPAARIVVFIPTFQQLDRMFKMLIENNFRDVKAIELIEREIQYKANAMRPATRMIGHTGFLLHGTFFPNFSTDIEE